MTCLNSKLDSFIRNEETGECKTGSGTDWSSGHKALHDDKPKLVTGVFLPQEVNKDKRHKVGFRIRNEII